MRLTTRVFLALGTLCLGSAAVFAQVYETRDAQGNPVFSDSPSQGAEAVDIPHTNVSDPVRVAPGENPEDEINQATPSGDAGDVVEIGGDDATDRENESIDNEGRRVVHDAARPHEVLDAEPRREVR